MALKGDFLGFEFNGRHSSNMGITRTSDGSRYNEDLLPTSQDKTAQVPGGHGTYFFESYYTQRQFSISFATDELTEEQFRSLRAWLQIDGIHDLIFDERPYKIYSAKVTGTPNFKYICFGNPRVYKGEGTIQFTCFYPFARSRYKFLDQYNNDSIDDYTLWESDKDYESDDKCKYDNKYYICITQHTSDINFDITKWKEVVPECNNKEEWAGSSGMLDEQSEYDEINSNSIKLFNPGDMETDFKAYYAVDGSSLGLTQIDIGNNSLSFSFGSLALNDSFICINSKTHLIEGCNNDYTPNGNLYNKYTTGGDFFKIPIITSTQDNITFNSTGVSCVLLQYDYLYY